MSDPAPGSPDEPLFRGRPYVLFLTGRFFGTLANGSQSVLLAWVVYEISRRTLSVAEASFLVGMIGLAQFLPVFALTLVAGETADRYSRRLILVACYTAQLLIAFSLAITSLHDVGLWPLFTLAALFGCARAFFQPSASALGPMLVPIAVLPRAIATNSLTAQFAMILGPALGGWLCTFSPVHGFAVCAGLYATAAACALAIRIDTRPPIEHGRSRVAQIREGLGYVWRNKSPRT
jgi:MFS family permease